MSYLQLRLQRRDVTPSKTSQWGEGHCRAWWKDTGCVHVVGAWDGHGKADYSELRSTLGSPAPPRHACKPSPPLMLIQSCHSKLASFSGVTTGCRRFTTRKIKCQLRRANRLCCDVLTMNIRCGSTLQKRVTGSNLFQCIFVDVSRKRQIIHLYSAATR